MTFSACETRNVAEQPPSATSALDIRFPKNRLAVADG